ncbi:uncharacterized protein LOC117649482 isoform X3 [Thrips palmi]|uniref:Uncharacterized protein LOC117649482 isoform X3 n=1 Tax=Thrips palmi TaxID=161013 RepID=A0A6P8ZSL4_THRPL|nr:uncharacterized protein LOC117649482 isoform X3 [Thrips palmi]
MLSCDERCQADLLHYVVVYWVLLLPVWLAGLLLMLALLLVGHSYRRWPVAVGGTLIGAAAALTTYGLWVAAWSTWSLEHEKVRASQPGGGFLNRML